MHGAGAAQGSGAVLHGQRGEGVGRFGGGGPHIIRVTPSLTLDHNNSKNSFAQAAMLTRPQGVFGGVMTTSGGPSEEAVCTVGVAAAAALLGRAPVQICSNTYCIELWTRSSVK